MREQMEQQADALEPQGGDDGGDVPVRADVVAEPLAAASRAGEARFAHDGPPTGALLTLAAARAYTAHGWHVVPLARVSKAPIHAG
jgi:hypothetical protein